MDAVSAAQHTAHGVPRWVGKLLRIFVPPGALLIWGSIPCYPPRQSPSSVAGRAEAGFVFPRPPDFHVVDFAQRKGNYAAKRERTVCD